MSQPQPLRRSRPRAKDFRLSPLLVFVAGAAVIALWARLQGLSLGFALSAAAAWLTLVLLVLVGRNLLLVRRQGRENVLPPALRVPALVSGWVGLAAFVAGLLGGRQWWR